MRKALIVLWMLLVPITTASAQVSIGIGLPGISIGINLPVYPELVRVPSYPVYYAPRLNSNYFFYDGMYWVYQEDNWYASSWYNGPWMLVAPEAVPLFILRVPVRYYRRPPAYFYGWSSDAAPRWGDHWGHDWEQSHGGWDNWNRRAVPAPAPLPIYQRQYSGDRYPRAEQQQVLERQNYRYQPRDPVVRQQFQAQGVQSAPAASPPARQAAPQQARPPQQGQATSSPPSSRQQTAPTAPRTQPPQTGGGNVQRSTPVPAPSQQLAAPAPSQQRAAPAPSQQRAAPAPGGQRQQKGGGEMQGPAAAKAPAPQAAPTPQPQARQPQQGTAQRQQQAPKPQGQAKGPAQPPKAQPQARQPQPQQGTAQRQQQAPKPQGQDKAPQGKGPAKEPKQGQEQRDGKGEQPGG